MISGFLGGLGGFAYIVPSVSTWNFEVGVTGFGFLALAVGGIASVDDSFHFPASSSASICKSVPFNLSFMLEPGSKHISTNSFIFGSIFTYFALHS